MSSNPTNHPGEYTCEMCHETYGKGWTDEEAYQETESYFGVRGDAPDMAVVCDDCFNKVHPARHPAEVETAKEALSSEDGSNLAGGHDVKQG